MGFAREDLLGSWQRKGFGDWVVLQRCLDPKNLETSAMAKKKKVKDENTLICANKRARFEFEILETFEAGIALLGSEVKALRQGGATIGESYARLQGREIVLVDSYIPQFTQASIFNHETRRARKLLLHKREIKGLDQQMSRKGLTLVPMRMYFTKRGFVKVMLGLGRGKKLFDKRQDMKAKTDKRDMERGRKELGRE